MIGRFFFFHILRKATSGVNHLPAAKTNNFQSKIFVVSLVCVGKSQKLTFGLQAPEEN